VDRAAGALTPSQPTMPGLDLIRADNRQARTPHPIDDVVDATL
jgi:hypothetical protein